MITTCIRRVLSNWLGRVWVWPAAVSIDERERGVLGDLHTSRKSGRRSKFLFFFINFLFYFLTTTTAWRRRQGGRPLIWILIVLRVHARAVWNRADRRIFSVSKFLVLKNRLVVSAWSYLCFIFFYSARFSVEKNECFGEKKRDSAIIFRASSIVSSYNTRIVCPFVFARFRTVREHAFTIFAVIVFFNMISRLQNTLTIAI